MAIRFQGGGATAARAVFFTSLAPYTYFLWLKTNASQGGDSRVLQMGTGGGGLSLGFQNSGRLLAIVAEGVSWLGGGVGKTMVDGVWVPVVVRRAAAGNTPCEMWCDGVR